MNEVAEIGLEDVRACASQEALQRIVDLARKVLKAASADFWWENPYPEMRRRVQSLDGSSASGLPEHADGAVSIAVPVLLSDDRLIGTLRVVDTNAREWSSEDRDLLNELAACLSSDVGLRLAFLAQEKVAMASERTKADFLSVADRIPGLVFRRRKIDAARSRYTFFGSDKSRLPAVRKMIEDGGAGDLGFVYCDDRETVRTGILRSNLEETDLDLTFRVTDFDHHIRWLRSQSIVRRDGDGTVFWDGLIYDISDLVTARADAEVDRAAKETLPQVEVSEALPAARVSSSAPYDGSGACILIADDLDLNRKLIADMLTLEGHVVECAANGAEALRLAGQHRFDLILMDMIMPVMDGIAATRAIRALPAPFCSVPIIALTAHSMREQLDACLKAGMDSTLSKPMSIDALNAAVDAWIGGRTKAA